MIKNLSNVGNGHALFLDKAILELLRITPNQPLELEVHGDILIVRPVRDEPRATRLRAARDKLRRRYEKTFRRLAE